MLHYGVSVKGSCSSGPVIPEEPAPSITSLSRQTEEFHLDCARVFISPVAAQTPEDHVEVGPRTCQALPG